MLLNRNRFDSATTYWDFEEFRTFRWILRVDVQRRCIIRAIKICGRNITKTLHESFWSMNNASTHRISMIFHNCIDPIEIFRMAKNHENPTSTGIISASKIPSNIDLVIIKWKLVILASYINTIRLYLLEFPMQEHLRNKTLYEKMPRKVYRPLKHVLK